MRERGLSSAPATRAISRFRGRDPAEAPSLPRAIPRDPSLDRSLTLWREGYEFVANRCRALGSDVVQVRLLFQDTLCLSGAEGAKLFYDSSRFQRAGAAPARVKRTLFGSAAIQGTDDERHRRRKAMFLSLMTPAGITRLAGYFAAHWRADLPRWSRQKRLVLFPAVREVLLPSICAWAGVPLTKKELPQRANDIAAVIDGTGGLGLRHWRGRIARRRCDAWMRDLVRQVRAGRIPAPPGSALEAVISHRDPGGDELDANTAGQELFNLIRPTVAIDRFITFAALALYQHPECRAEIASGSITALEDFVHEVRRFFPFFPFVAARVRETFEWRGYRFPGGARVLLDLYGTDHDPRLWDRPDQFVPSRFRTWDGSAFNFIPQGGGDHATGHRCPGEWITIELMKTATLLLVNAMSYDVPPQDLSVSLRRMPAIPASGFVMANVQPAAG